MVEIHWPGNKWEHIMLAGTGKTLCGLLLMPGASSVYFSEDRGPMSRPLCDKCAVKMDEARAIAAK